MKIDKEISDDIFHKKDQEYRNQIIDITYQMDAASKINPNLHDTEMCIFELAKRLPSLYLKANNEEKAMILRYVYSNFILTDGKLVPVHKKAFAMIIEDINFQNGGVR